MPPRSSKCSHFPNFELRKVLGLVTAHLMWPVFAYNACRFHEIFEGNGPCVALYSVGWASGHFHDLRSNSHSNRMATVLWSENKPRWSMIDVFCMDPRVSGGLFGSKYKIFLDKFQNSRDSKRAFFLTAREK